MGLTKEQIEGHKQRIKTRKKKGWWQSPNAIENMRQAQLHLSKEIKEKRAKAMKNNDWYKFIGFRNLIKRINKLRNPNISKQGNITFKYVLCELCKKGFYSYPIGHGKWKKYCSKKCQMISQGNRLRGQKKLNFCGKNNPSYTNGKYKEKYKRIRVNGESYDKHIFVCLRKMGLHRLPKGCCVHHIDRDKHNNSPENLQLLEINYHNNLHKILCKKQ